MDMLEGSFSRIKLCTINSSMVVYSMTPCTKVARTACVGPSQTRRDKSTPKFFISPVDSECETHVVLRSYEPLPRHAQARGQPAILCIVISMQCELSSLTRKEQYSAILKPVLSRSRETRPTV